MAQQSGDYPSIGLFNPSLGAAGILAALLGGDASFVGVDLAESEATMLKRSNGRLRQRNRELRDELTKTGDYLGAKIDDLRRDRDALQERIDALVEGAESSDDMIANLTTVAQAAVDLIGDRIEDDISEDPEAAQLYFDLRAVVKAADAHLEGTLEGIDEATFGIPSAWCGPGCACFPESADAFANINPFDAFGGEPEE